MNKENKIIKMITFYTEAHKRAVVEAKLCSNLYDSSKFSRMAHIYKCRLKELRKEIGY